MISIEEYKFEMPVCKYILDIMEDLSYSLVKTPKGHYILVDDVNGDRTRGIIKPSEILDSMGTLVQRLLLDDFEKELDKRGVESMVMSDEFLRFMSESKNKEIVEEYKWDFERILLVSNQDYLNKHCKLEDLVA